LVLERNYEDIKVDDILTRAGVGRSTFYEHFNGKDDILAVSLRYPLPPLADAMRARDNTDDIVRMLEHFWENRAIMPSIFTGSARAVVSSVLVDLIEERFKLDRVESPNPLIIPSHMAATQIAESLLAPVTAWLLGESQCTKEALALVLRQTAMATLQAQRSRNL
jgi:AcrR family transcriptional regulator